MSIFGFDCSARNSNRSDRRVFMIVAGFTSFANDPGSVPDRHGEIGYSDGSVVMTYEAPEESGHRLDRREPSLL